MNFSELIKALKENNLKIKSKYSNTDIIKNKARDDFYHLKIYLNDIRGYFRDIVTPNFNEFIEIYEFGSFNNKKDVTILFSKLVNLCLTVNHQSDKVAESLEGINSGYDLIKEIKKIREKEGNALNNIRVFSNNLKHNAKEELRIEVKEDNGKEKPEWYFLTENTEKVRLCESAIIAYFFWNDCF